MLNHIWLWMIAISVVLAAGNDIYNEAFKRAVSDEQSFLLEVDAISDPEAFVKKLTTAERPHAGYVNQLLSNSTREMLANYRRIVQVNSDTKPSNALLSAIVEDLNRVMKEKNIYDADAFGHIPLPPEMENKTDKDLQGEELARFNRNLLVLAFKNELTKQRNLNEDTRLGQVTTAAIDAAALGVQIAIGLIGVMALWLGIMKVAEEGGMINVLARIVRPITRRLFPSIPSDHPSIGAMIMNIAANMLGLSNAATPLGLKAMEELDKLNPKKGEATDDMITFLVINTSAITIVPATAIAIRASLGSVNPQKIVIPSILAATMATIVGVTTVKLIQFFKNKRNGRSAAGEEGGQNGSN